MDEATHAGRVVAMNDGKIVADGTPEEVFSQVELLRSVGLSVPETTEPVSYTHLDVYKRQG